MDYLVNFGRAGDFSRFRTTVPAAFQRGDRVVVRTHQGVELGVVMCPASPDHARYLSDKGAGELLRHATPEDEQAAADLVGRSGRLFDDARCLAVELELPLEILDMEVLFDGRQAIIHYLCRQDCDYRPFVSTLSRRHDLLIVMQNLALPMERDEHSQGCGKPDCGKAGGGGCTTCGTGGGCSAGSCGAGIKKEDVAVYLAGLRQSMEASPRTSLL
jgi:cell fate regulator YaaT (PSP1 superfamily)